MAVKLVRFDKETGPLCFGHAALWILICWIGYYLENNSMSKLCMISNSLSKSVASGFTNKANELIDRLMYRAWSRMVSLRGSRVGPK